MGEKKMAGSYDNYNNLIIALIFFVILCFIFGIGTTMLSVMENSNIVLDDSTAIKICNELNNSTNIEFKASSENGKLICEAPSYDNTQQIVFINNGGNK